MSILLGGYSFRPLRIVRELFSNFRMLESNKDKGVLDINCCDPLGRSALLMAIDNENLEIIELLLDNKVYHKSTFLCHI